MSGRPLPPNGRRFLDDPSNGVHVAIGPDAWRYSKLKPFTVMVCPQEDQPSDFQWPSHAGGAVIYERGAFDDERLTALAAELITAGNPFCVAIREALLDSDPRTFFYREGTQ